MNAYAIAISAYAKSHTEEETARLIGRLLGNDMPRDDHGHFYKEAGARCPHVKPHRTEKFTKNRLQLYQHRGKINRKQYEKSFRVAERSKGFTAEVYDPETGENYSFVKGSKVEKIKTFAGYGGTKELRPEVIEGLCKTYGGDPKKWSHRKGIALINKDGEEVRAEVHWFQEETAGKVSFKLKKWDEEN